MNKIIRKSFLSIFTLILLGCVCSISLLADDITEAVEAKYYVESVADANELNFGVSHHRDVGMSMVTGSTYIKSASADGAQGGTLAYNKWYSQQVNVMEVNADENTKIIPWTALQDGKWTLTTVRDMAKDFENKNPGWKVVGAINGDFFDIGASNNFPYTPLGSNISNGEAYRVISDNGWGALGINNESEGKKLYGAVGGEFGTDGPYLSVYDSNGNIVLEKKIAKVNTAEVNEGEIGVYFSTYLSNKKLDVMTVSNESAYVVEAATDTVPCTDTSGFKSFYGKGTISKIGAADLQVQQFAVVVNDESVSSLMDVGTTIRVQYKLSGEIANYDNVIGMKGYVLRDSEPVVSSSDDYGTTRFPRTMIGQKADGTVVMIVIDGRQGPKGYYGAFQNEMSAICLHYGLVDAYQFDGGGSATMAIYDDVKEQLQIVNSPSDGDERRDSNCLLVATRVPEYEVTPQTTTATSLTFKVTPSVVMEEYNDVYIEINKEMKKVEATGVVSFENLKADSIYHYKVYTKNSSDQYIFMHQYGDLTTAKVAPELSPNIYYSVQTNKNNEQECVIQYTILKADAFSGITLTIDDQVFVGTKGTIVVPIAYKEALINNQFVVTITYDIVDGNGPQEIKYSDTKLKITIPKIMLDIILDETYNELLKTFSN